MQEITVRSTRQQDLIDITSQVNDAIQSWTCSGVLLYIPHTTAGLLVNEHADPSVAQDILAALDRIVPADGIYRHGEGNSPAHVKTSLVGTSQLLPMVNGALGLGTWQGVFLAEFDGPRSRRVVLVPMGGSPG